MIREIKGRLKLVKVVIFKNNGAQEQKKKKIVGYIIENIGTDSIIIKHSIDGKIQEETIKVGQTTMISRESLLYSKKYYNKIEYVGCKIEESINGKVVALTPNLKSDVAVLDCGIYGSTGLLEDIDANIKKYLDKNYVNREICMQDKRNRNNEIKKSSLYLCKVIKFKCNGDSSKGKIMAYMLKSMSNQSIEIVNSINGVLTKQIVEPYGYIVIDKKHLRHFYEHGGKIANAMYVSGEGILGYLKFKNSEYSVNDDDKVIDIYRDRTFAKRIINFLNIEHIQEVQKYVG